MANFCSKCGTEIPVGEGFCPKCGNMVSMNAASVVSTGMQTTFSQGNNRVSGGTQKQSPIGIAAGILGIAGLLLSILIVGGVLGFAAVILSVIVLSRKSEYKTGMAIAGVITGGTAIIVGLIVSHMVSYDRGHEDGYYAGRSAGYGEGYVDGAEEGYYDGLDVPWYEKLFY